ncbi:MAG TPA: hypothetical protein VF638_14810 [Sphingomonas sp.]|jgi:hypothetical protein
MTRTHDHLCRCDECKPSLASSADGSTEWRIGLAIVALFWLAAIITAALAIVDRSW